MRKLLYSPWKTLSFLTTREKHSFSIDDHTVFAAIACMYDCNLTIIQSMPDDTHAFQLLSGKSLALELTNPHYDKTVQWRKANVQGVFQPLFLPQRGM